MNQTCDRCGPAIGAAYPVDRVGELYLCGHCASRPWRARSAQGWTCWPVVDRQGIHQPDRAFGLLGPGDREGVPGEWFP